MNKGPKMNNTKRAFTTRDNLGIEGVSTSISGNICPIVNTVTPRAFYWVFLTWIYYDLRNLNVGQANYDVFYKHLRRQDYFFVVANLLNSESDQFGMVGKEKVTENINKNTSGIFEYDDAYFKAKLGGMYYFNAGLLTMNLINDHERVTGEQYKFPHLTQKAEKIAQAFESVIKDTTYYKEYRLNDKPVPKEVLIELGNILNIGLVGFDEVKKLMRNLMFGEPTATYMKLIESSKYLKFINKQYNIVELNERKCREIFFDYFSERSENKFNYPKELKNIIEQWEIVVGRQYFTSGVEAIWKYMLENLSTEKDEKRWIEDCINESKFSIDIENTIESILADCNYNYQIREDMITECRKGTNNNIQYGLQIILSIYNRFKDRNYSDGETESYIYEGEDNDSISLNQMMLKIDEYKNRTIKEFIEYIMLNWLIRQHERTAFSKLLQGRNGYYIEKFDGKYLRKSNSGVDFQGIRMVQLMQVMKDLDMLEVR